MRPRHGLVAEYRFSGNAEDGSGNGHDGVVHGATLTTDRFGHPDSAYRFDGIDDWIEVAPPPQLSREALTVSAWARYEPRDFAGWTGCIVAQDDGNDEDQSRRVFQLSTDCGRIVWHRMIHARDPRCRRRVRPGVWYHAVAVHDRGRNLLYLDGVLQDTVEDPLTVHPEQPVMIGRKGTPEPYFFFRGDIDDVLIYDRALGDAEIGELLHEGGWQPAASATPAGEDPLSGWWGQDGVVFLDLRYDVRRRVSGRIMDGRPSNMAEISTGRFDRETGALMLSGSARGPRDGGPVSWSIEGTLDDDELAVIARIRDFSGNFTLTRRGTRFRWTWRSIRSHLGAVAYRSRRPL